MSKLKFFTFAICLAFAIAPISTSFAGSPDYSKKKSGGVTFTPDEPADETAEATDETHPADIEPAAGASEEEDEKEENSLSNDMKLPRK